MFWAVMAEMADMKAMGTSIPKPMMRSTTPTAADWSRPMPLTMAVMSRKDRLTRKSCMAMGCTDCP